MSSSSPWINLARLNVPITVAADTMKVSKATAARRLEQAEAALGQLPTELQAAAVAVILAPNIVRQDISRRAWQDVLLGYKRAA